MFPDLGPVSLRLPSLQRVCITGMEITHASLRMLGQSAASLAAAPQSCSIELHTSDRRLGCSACCDPAEMAAVAEAASEEALRPVQQRLALLSHSLEPCRRCDNRCYSEGDTQQLLVALGGCVKAGGTLALTLRYYNWTLMYYNWTLMYYNWTLMYYNWTLMYYWMACTIIGRFADILHTCCCCADAM